MSWINEISSEDAKGYLDKIYRDIEKSRGKVANILRVHSLNPKALRAHLMLYNAIMFENSTINRELCELIAVIVSSMNKCAYCINHHAESLRKYRDDVDQILNSLELLSKNPDSKIVFYLDALDFREREKAIAKYAIKLTINQENMQNYDIQKLKKLNIDDEAILQINLIISYFNFVNRIALGLGVEYTEDEIQGYKA
ncbi:MAG: peroxidase-related enzyme [Candidatus Zixiibacteriota bacterium]